MQLDELKEHEQEVRETRMKKLKTKQKTKEVDFQVEEAKFKIGGQKISNWVAFFILASTIDLLISYIAFGDNRVSVCSGDVSEVIAHFCIGWQYLFILTFSTAILPITVLIGTVEFFCSIQEDRNARELTEQLQFQEDIKLVSKILVYSVFILAVQILTYYKAFELLPEVLRLPFVIFGTDAMLPVALALLFYSVRKRLVFYVVGKRLLCAVIIVNLASTVFSRGIQLVWHVCVCKFF